MELQTLSVTLIDINNESSSTQQVEQAPRVGQAQCNLARKQEQWELKVRSCYERVSAVSLLVFFIISYATPVRTLVEVCTFRIAN